MKEEREYVWEFKGKLIHLYERDIYYVHLERRHIYVHTRNRCYLIGRKIQEEEDYLREMPVIRTHYSYLVHMRYLEALSGTEIILRNGEHVPVSASRKRQVQETVKHYFHQVKNVQNGRKTALRPYKSAEALREQENCDRL